MERIIKKLKLLRQSKGITQEEFAAKLNLSLPAYSKIERGITDVNLSRLGQICAVLGVKPAVFFEEVLGEEKNIALEGQNTHLKYLLDALRDKEEIIALQKKYIEHLEQNKAHTTSADKKERF